MSAPNWDHVGDELAEVEKGFLLADASVSGIAHPEPSELELQRRAELETARRRLRALKELIADATAAGPKRPLADEPPEA